MRKSVRQLAAIAATALACLGSAQASITTLLDFEPGSGLDTTYAGFAPFMTHGDALIQGDYAIGTVSTKSGAAPGNLVGLLVDGTDLASTCFGVTCPSNNSTNFLAMVDSGLPYLFRLDGGTFHINSFDAGFVAAEGATVPAVAAILRVYGFTADNNVFFEDVLLPGLSNGLLSFSNFSLSSAFSGREYAEVDFYGYACDASGSCSRATNTAQFALDNISVDIPEPTPLALVALGLAALALKRRQAA